MLNTDRKITGTPTEYQYYSQLTYTAADTDDGAAKLTFNLTVGPKATTLTATPGNGQVTLAWTAIPGVSSWKYAQDGGSWTDISGSGELTDFHVVTGLTNSTQANPTSYIFSVYAVAKTASNYEINGLSSNSVTVIPLSTKDNTPRLRTVTDKLFPQGEEVDITLPEASGGDGHPNYAYTLSPAVPGLTFTAANRKLAGTPTTLQAKVTYTYTATEETTADSDPESADTTFTIGIRPHKPASFTATAGDTKVTLAWAAIAGVTKWQYLQNTSSSSNTTWADITGSGPSTASHTVASLISGTAYTFKVRALVGDSSATPSTQVIGVESDAASATPVGDLVPILTDIADQLYVQGEAVDFTLPVATGGDSHPNYTYTLTPDVSGSGLTFTAANRKLSGTPSAPKGKVTYTYTATENADDDGTTESGSKTFTIGVHPHKPVNFKATAGNGQVVLSWTAIPGVDSWDYQLDNDAWVGIVGSDATTTTYTVTGLTNRTEYTFKVNTVVGTGDAEILGLASDPVKATPGVPTPPFNGVIADKVYIQDQEELVFDRFPSATPVDPANATRLNGMRYYIYPEPPSGIVFDSVPPSYGWAGFPDTPMPVTTYYYGVREKNGLYTAITFTVSVKPKEPAGFTATAGTRKATLRWMAIPGVTGWEYQQRSAPAFPFSDWTAISGSGATVTGLSAGKTYTFKVRAFVGTGDAKVEGVASVGATITTPQ